MDKTICELFAGVGGFRLGFEAIHKDWKTVWFSQWEPNTSKQWAHQCYVAHWGDIDNETGIDIAKVNKEKIPNHNLLVGGFPCQDYSVANSLSYSKGIEGKKGVLWWEIRDTLIHKKPSFVLLENVDRLLKSPASQKGRDFGIILSCFAELDYIVEWRVINAADYGAAQRRRRIYIFAYKKHTQYAKKYLNVKIDNSLINKSFFKKVFPINNIENENYGIIDYTDIPKISSSYTFNFMDTGIMINGELITYKSIPQEIKPIPIKDIMEHNVDAEYYIDSNIEKWSYLKGAKKIERKSKDGHVYKFSEGAISFPDSINMPARTMLTSEGTLNRSTHVIEDYENKKLRLITPIEAERIQGFPDNWTNTGMTKRMRYFCMGNALVVQMIQKMAEEINIIFDHEN